MEEDSCSYPIFNKLITYRSSVPLPACFEVLIKDHKDSSCCSSLESEESNTHHLPMSNYFSNKLASVKLSRCLQPSVAMRPRCMMMMLSYYLTKENLVYMET